MILRKVHLSLRTIQGTPVANWTLECTKLAILEAAGVAPLKLTQQCRRLQITVRVQEQQRNDELLLDNLEWVRPSAPPAFLAFRTRKITLLPATGCPNTYRCRRCCLLLR